MGRKTKTDQTVTIIATLSVGLNGCKRSDEIEVDIPAGLMDGEVDELKQKAAEEWANNYLDIFYTDKP